MNAQGGRFPVPRRWTRLLVYDHGAELREPSEGSIVRLNRGEAAVLTLFRGTFDITSIVAALSADVGEATAENAVRHVLNKFGHCFDLHDAPTDDTSRYCGSFRLRSSTWTPPVRYDYPQIINIILTDACNFDCSYCFRQPVRQEGSLVPYKVREVIAEAAARGGLRMVFSGGEPLIDSELVDYVASCIDHNVFPYLATNASLLAPPISKRLVELGIPLIQISLDTLDRSVAHALNGYGNVGHVLMNVERAIKEGLRVILRIVLCKPNLSGLDRLIDYAASLGVHRVDITPAVPFGPLHSESSRRILLDRAETRSAWNLACARKDAVSLRFDGGGSWRSADDIRVCSGLVNSVSIQPNGDVVACSNVPRWKYGNVYDQTLGDAWESERFQEIRRAQMERSRVSVKCAGCEHFDPCYTGCVWFKEVSGLPHDEPDPRCFVNKTVPPYFGDTDIEVRS